MEYSYKFRIYPSKTQVQQIQRTFGCCRFVWNYYLAMRKDIYEQDGKTMNYYACCKDMTQLKKTLLWLKEADATALQSSLQNLDAAYQNFFRRVKQGQKPGYPKFKSKRNRRQSYKSKSVKIFCCPVLYRYTNRIVAIYRGDGRYRHGAESTCNHL